MKGFVGAFVAVMFGAVSQGAAACDWHQYEPQLESLQGTLVWKSYPDETTLVIELTTPLSMIASTGYNIEELQVRYAKPVFGPATRLVAVEQLLGKTVTVRGTIFRTHVGLHQERVGIEALSIE